MQSSVYISKEMSLYYFKLLKKPTPLDERQGAPLTGHQSLTGPKQAQTTMLTLTPKVHLESPNDLT